MCEERNRHSQFGEDMLLSPLLRRLAGSSRGTFVELGALDGVASFRLNEVMRAGCIPIFVSGDAKTTSPYVRPFAEVIPWQQISLHASYDHLSSGAFRAALQRIPAAKLQHMQHGVLHAWTHHLAPAASARTFYQLLRGRAEFRDRR